jgi:hypothetical protein
MAHISTACPRRSSDILNMVAVLVLSNLNWQRDTRKGTMCACACNNHAQQCVQQPCTTRHHSATCLAVAHWQLRSETHVRAACTCTLTCICSQLQCMSCHSPVAAAAPAVEEVAAHALPTAAGADDAWPDMAWRETPCSHTHAAHS